MDVALKGYMRHKMDPLFSEMQISREIKIHSSVNHPFVASFYGAFEDDDVGRGRRGEKRGLFVIR